MRFVYGYAVGGQICGAVCRVNCHQRLECTAVVAAVAYHARHGRCHVLYRQRQFPQLASPQPCQRTRHARACGYGASAEGRQPARVLLYIHTHQITQRRGPQQLFTARSAHSVGGIEWQRGYYAVGSAARDAHGRQGQSQHTCLDGGGAEQDGCGVLVGGYCLRAVPCIQLARDGGAAALDCTLKECQVKVIRLAYKIYLVNGHRPHIAQQLAQRVAVDVGRLVCGPRGYPRLSLVVICAHLPSVMRYPCYVSMCAAYAHRGGVSIGRDGGRDAYLAAYAIHLNPHFALSHQPARQ